MFWDCSLGEVLDLIESFRRIQKNKSDERELELKETIVLNTVLARQVGEFIGAQFSNEAVITPLHELFPELFKKEVDEAVEIENRLVLNKARMEEYAYKHNLSLKGRRKEDGRSNP